MIEAIEYHLGDYQLDFFKSDEDSRKEAEFEKIKKSLDRVRKGTYAKINEMQKKLDEMTLEFEIMKKHICQG